MLRNLIKETIAPHLPKEVRQKGKGDYSQPRWFLNVVSLAALFGFVSGLVGGIVINSGYFDRLLWGDYGVNQAGNQTRRPDYQQLNRDDLSSKVLAGTVELYLSNARVGNEAILDPSQKLATGFFLTADGWIACSKNILGRYGRSDIFVITADRKILAVEKILIDPISDLAFLKTKISNVSVLPFAFFEDIGPGTEVFLPQAGAGLLPTKVVAVNGFFPRSKADYFFSSENLYRRGLLSESFEKEMVGAPLVNSRGEILGVLSGVVDGKGAYSYFLRSSILRVAFRRAMDSGSINRAYMGFHFTEPNQMLQTADGYRRGIVLAADTYRKLPAVERRSPLAAAGLKAGDIMLAIGNESITVLRTLPEILADYLPGDKIEITYRRGVEEKKTEVLLGAFK